MPDLPDKTTLKINIQRFEAGEPGFTAAYHALAKMPEGIDIDRNKKPVNPHFTERFSCLAYLLTHKPEILRKQFGIVMSADMCVDGWGGAYNLSVAPDFRDLLAELESAKPKHATSQTQKAENGWLSGMLNMFRGDCQTTRQ